MITTEKLMDDLEDLKKAYINMRGDEIDELNCRANCAVLLTAVEYLLDDVYPDEDILSIFYKPET